MTIRKTTLKRQVNKPRRVANKHVASVKNKKTKKSNLAGGTQTGGAAARKEKFQVTTLRSISQKDLDRMKISNYVNDNIDWGILPGPPPTDCCIM